MKASIIRSLALAPVLAFCAGGASPAFAQDQPKALTSQTQSFLDAIRGGSCDFDKLLATTGLSEPKLLKYDEQEVSSMLQILQAAQAEFIADQDVHDEKCLLDFVDNERLPENRATAFMGLFPAVDICSLSITDLLISRDSYMDHAKMFDLSNGKKGDLFDVVQDRKQQFMDSGNSGRAAQCEGVRKLLRKGEAQAHLKIDAQKRARQMLATRLSVRDKDFKNKTVKGKAIVFVSTQHCGACDDLAQPFLKLAEDYKGCIQFLYYDHDQNPGLDVKSFPRRLYFKDGKQVGEAIGTGGFMKESRIERLINQEIATYLWSADDALDCVKKKLAAKKIVPVPRGNERNLNCSLWLRPKWMKRQRVSNSGTVPDGIPRNIPLPEAGGRL